MILVKNIKVGKIKLSFFVLIFFFSVFFIVMNKNLFTYKKSGVNIDKADKFVNFIANITSKKRGNKKLNKAISYQNREDLAQSIHSAL